MKFDPSYAMVDPTRPFTVVDAEQAAADARDLAEAQAEADRNSYRD